MIIPEETKKRLDMMIKGHIQKRDYKEHLEEYHFKSFDEIIEYLKNGGEVLFENSNDKIVFDETCEIIDIMTKNKNNGHTYVEPLTIDMFRDKYFFTFLPDSTGYIPKYHKENNGKK